MSKKSNKSILFVRPDYHCSFFYRKNLREMGWKADIFVEASYPKQLLYQNDEILTPFQLNDKFFLSWYLNKILNFFYYLRILSRYKYYVYYSRPSYTFDLWENKLRLDKIFGSGFSLSLSIAKLFGRKIIYLPAGCHDVESQEVYMTFDNGNVCKNCGSFDKCDDRLNNQNFSTVRRYADLVIGDTFLNSSQFSSVHFRYKSIDLDLWNPGIVIPEKYRLEDNGKLRILHSYIQDGRDFAERNIKGSQYILAAIDRLISEGYPVEYFCISNLKSNEMRYMQVQADILVEQLIYGSWGSTGVECMALGKPVICYMRQSCKDFFLKTFPEYNELPIIEANTSNIYQVLKKAVTDTEFREKEGIKSRKFAERHFDPRKNAETFSELLLEL